jgi:hypothetical protein
MFRIKVTEFRELKINVFHHPTGSRRQKSDYDELIMLPHLAAARLTRSKVIVFLMMLVASGGWTGAVAMAHFAALHELQIK